MTELGEFGMGVAVGGGLVAFWVAMGPIVRALAGRIAGRGRADDDWRRRIDFAERLLTQRSTAALPPRAEP